MRPIPIDIQDDFRALDIHDLQERLLQDGPRLPPAVERAWLQRRVACY